MDLLRISNLNIDFAINGGTVCVSKGVNLRIRQNDALCLVGESGCGKSILALAVMGLLPSSARISGDIRFKGSSLFSMGKKKMRRMRGREIAMIFEQPATCLNPVFTVGNQIAEAVRIHEKCSKKEARSKAVNLMEMVGISSPGERFRQYPHEFSGGMQQRIMIAVALAFKPSLLIADEPTTSLDVTIQAQIMDLLRDLISRFKISLFLITHDLGLSAEMSKRVAVMYAGEIVEKGNLKDIFAYPRHPYTRALLRAISKEGLRPIAGSVPEFTSLPEGCRFHPRCPSVMEICRHEKPKMRDGVMCHL
jgi:oligopeptide/dipeptide ABC transporter ATP-binding protein